MRESQSKLVWLTCSACSYFDNIERIAQPDYMPNDQDVLRSRVKTTGITETTFIIGDLTYRMFDVGGQRSERKKWIHCFENVTTILFLVAISEYDQLLFEDETVNRMQEALTLFDSICNSRWFIKTSIILFLNKIDRFKEKLPVSPMKNYFPDYEGGDDYALACDYILNRFVSLNQHETKQIYTHFTCATDTTQIRFVMAAVNGKLVASNSSLGLIFCRYHNPREPPSLRSHLKGEDKTELCAWQSKERAFPSFGYTALHLPKSAVLYYTNSISITPIPYMPFPSIGLAVTILGLRKMMRRWSWRFFLALSELHCVYLGSFPFFFPRFEDAPRRLPIRSSPFLFLQCLWRLGSSFVSVSDILIATNDKNSPLMMAPLSFASDHLLLNDAVMGCVDEKALMDEREEYVGWEGSL
jgi:hypothetical protein